MSVEYDLKGAIEAYGYREVCDMMELILAGKIEIITNKLSGRKPKINKANVKKNTTKKALPRNAKLKLAA